MEKGLRDDSIGGPERTQTAASGGRGGVEGASEDAEETEGRPSVDVESVLSLPKPD